jgi:hypothetical protein
VLDLRHLARGDRGTKVWETLKAKNLCRTKPREATFAVGFSTADGSP